MVCRTSRRPKWNDKRKNVDFVVIAPDEYLAYANKLADLHSQYDGVSTLVVTPQQIYNEFSSGTPDATAYRWLMKSIYDRAADGHKPQNLLLFGDATYDHRGYQKVNVPYNKVLTYESVNSLHTTTGSYATDDYFAMLSDEAGANLVSDTMNLGRRALWLPRCRPILKTRSKATGRTALFT